MNRLPIALALGVGLTALAMPVLPGSASALVATPLAVTAVGGGAIGLGVLLLVQDRGPEQSSVLSPSSTAATDDRVGWRIDGVVRSDSPASTRQSPLRIRRTLRRTLDTVLVERAGLTDAAATERRKAGTWTSNPRAATFLGETDTRSRRLRARDWLYGDAFTRNLQATVAELDRLATDIDRSHRVDSIWEGDHRTDDAVGDAGVPMSAAVGDAPADGRSRDGDGRAWIAAARFGDDRAGLDDALDERASAMSRSDDRTASEGSR